MAIILLIFFILLFMLLLLLYNKICLLCLILLRTWLIIRNLYRLLLCYGLWLFNWLLWRFYNNLWLLFLLFNFLRLMFLEIMLSFWYSTIQTFNSITYCLVFHVKFKIVTPFLLLFFIIFLFCIHFYFCLSILFNRFDKFYWRIWRLSRFYLILFWLSLK